MGPKKQLKHMLSNGVPCDEITRNVKSNELQHPSQNSNSDYQADPPLN